MPDFFGFGRSVEEIAGDHGFWEDEHRNEPVVYKEAKISLMVSELAECIEGIRKGIPDSHIPEFSSEVVELADALIRICDYCYHYNLPINEAVKQKIIYNKTRPYKHGKAN